MSLCMQSHEAMSGLHLSAVDMRRLVAQIIRHEGTKRNAQGRHIAYRCTAGALTIGYGHNLDATPIAGISAASSLSEEEARLLLMRDIESIEKDMQRALPWCVKLDSVRYATLLNMAFNMGIGGLCTFRNTLRDVQCGSYTSASSRMLESKWAAQVHYRAREMSHQMLTGEWA